MIRCPIFRRSQTQPGFDFSNPVSGTEPANILPPSSSAAAALAPHQSKFHYLYQQPEVQPPLSDISRYQPQANPSVADVIGYRPDVDPSLVSIDWHRRHAHHSFVDVSRYQPPVPPAVNRYQSQGEPSVVNEPIFYAYDY